MVPPRPPPGRSSVPTAATMARQGSGQGAAAAVCKTLGNTAFCFLFSDLSKPQECGGARGPQSGGERVESEEEEEEVAFEWFPPALETNFSL